MLQVGAPRTQPITILSVDDDQRSQRLLRLNLEPLDHRVVTVERAGDAIAALEAYEPDLVVLDMRLADGDGFEVLHQIRQISSVPVIVVSALGDPVHKVRALEHGADDYVTKPYDSDELTARIDAVLRRVQRKHAVSQPLFVNGPLTIDFQQQLVRLEGREIVLSTTEYRLLEYLARNVGCTVITDALLTNVWGPEYSGQDALVHIYISRLRRKLGDSARQPRFIGTKARIGYLMLLLAGA